MFRNVLLGLDFSPSADDALTAAIELAERHGGRLTIVTAIPEVHGWATGPVETMTAASQLNAQLEREAIALQHRALERVPACLPVSTIIRRAPARKALLEALRDGRHDTLVIGASSCHTRFRVTRSLTRCLVRHAGVPVLVAERDGPPRLIMPPAVDEAAPEVAPPAPAGAPPRSAPT